VLLFVTVLQVCLFIKDRHVKSDTVHILSNWTRHDLSTSRYSKRFCKFNRDTQMPYTLKIMSVSRRLSKAEHLFTKKVGLILLSEALPVK